MWSLQFFLSFSFFAPSLHTSGSRFHLNFQANVLNVSIFPDVVPLSEEAFPGGTVVTLAILLYVMFTASQQHTKHTFPSTGYSRAMYTLSCNPDRISNGLHSEWKLVAANYKRWDVLARITTIIRKLMTVQCRVVFYAGP